jgi:hypothetical protein
LIGITLAARNQRDALGARGNGTPYERQSLDAGKCVDRLSGAVHQIRAVGVRLGEQF